jgi:hypothetical protein
LGGFLALSCVSRGAFAGSLDTCITKSLIAFPSGLIQQEGINLATLDKDQDGLLDAAEDELAACVAPLYKFDSQENARFADEPVVLHRVFPRFFSPAGNLVVHVRSHRSWVETLSSSKILSSDSRCPPSISSRGARPRVMARSERL